MFLCRSRCVLGILAVTLGISSQQLDAAEKEAKASDFSPEHIEFFEKSVKPILTAHCIKCHGGEKKIGGGLRLTNRASVLKGGDTGPGVSVESPEESVILSAINYEDYEMPPKGKLPPAEIEILTKWAKLGAPWTPGDHGPMHADETGEHGPPQINDETRKFWSFQPIKRPPVPQVKNADWVKNPIDAFIMRGLEKNNFRPAPPAERLALLRRAFYDLTGLPPSQADVERFLADKSPDAYEKLLDRLLASPQYGEKWARHWLDLVHYAESNSYERDNPKPEVWRYREYVIRSLNEDKPIDQFYTEQLAGDELPNPTVDSLIATGYYRLGLWDDESPDPPLSRFDELDDWVTITSQVMLGLTMNCARCHAHKIDPIPHEDYYRFLAFFHGVKSYQNGPDGHRKNFNTGNFLGKLSEVLSPEEQKNIREEVAAYGPKIDALKREIGEFDRDLVAKLKGGQKDDYGYPSNRVHIVREIAGKLISAKEAERYLRNARELERLEHIRSSIDAKVLCAKGTPKPPVTHIKIRGNAGVNGKQVQPGFPQVLGFEDPVFPEPAPGAKSSGRRLVLAKWITSEENPLTARVLANRLWQHHFGRGIVRSTNNFGFNGDAPTHPELLDWLAAELVQRGWRLKTMHKLLMMSATYQMSSKADPAALAKDPQNNAFWRFNMRRLTAEEIRDTVLATNGRLNLKV
ncbi:MAG: PSD1 and planctomycete cytochrome C domain-containing protein, partial [Pirellulales bacterium]|nr:PSD1 and planctomycete cytochrome C domain-containing protein [Pirellulales bacterium]